MAHPVPSPRSLRSFSGLRSLIAILRGPEGCPWDRVQTPDTLRPYLLEEAMETLDALDGEDPGKLREELGDLLFEVLLQVQLAEESGAFRMSDVIYDIASKLVRRHPHVFAEAVAETPEAVVAQWDELKQRERSNASALAGVPGTLAALAYAQAIQRRAGRTGFEWESVDQAWDAMREELGELESAISPGSQADELGDVLFALANLARYLHVDAEDALRRTCLRFARRFQRMEEIVRARGIDIKAVGMLGKRALWQEAKDAQ